MHPLATSSDGSTALPRGLVPSDRSTSVYSRKRRVATPVLSASASTRQQQQQPSSSPQSPSTEEEEAPDSIVSSFLRLARSSRSHNQQLQRYSNAHLVPHPRDHQRGVTHVAATASRHALGAVRTSTTGQQHASPHTYDPFPAERYEFVRAWTPHDPTNSATSSFNRSNNKKRQVLHAVVARDRITNALVVLTCVAKAIVTERQIAHLQRVSRTLERAVHRHSFFQRLLNVYDAEKNWIFVQAFDATWSPVDNVISEELLRAVVLQVVARLHFLHAHVLSLAGEFTLANVVMAVDDACNSVVMLWSVPFALSGSTLVTATERTRAADVKAIGQLMLQLCRVPCDADDVISNDVLVSQLQHLSAHCRNVLLDCLTGNVTIDALLQRKWLRPIDFVSIASKLDFQVAAAAGCSTTTASALFHFNRLLNHSVVWNVVAGAIVEWFYDPQAFAALQVPSTATLTTTTTTATATEEDELRQKQRKINKRSVALGRKLLLLTNHSPHWLKRGAAIVPPLGSAILPHDFTADDDDNNNKRNIRIDAVLQTWTHDAIAPRSLSKSNSSNSSNSSSYNVFAYDSFGSFESDYRQEQTYDAFEWPIDQQQMDDDSVAVAPGDHLIRRTRTLSSSSLLHENVAAHALQHATLRSLQTSSSHSSHSHSSSDSSSRQADATAAAQQTPRAFEVTQGTDPLFFSAFGPRDVARRETFRVDIWAFLKQQRSEMLETARELNESEVALHVQPFCVARGTLVTIVLEQSDCFGVYGDDCKTFRWRGDVSGVSFALYRKQQLQDDVDANESELVIARIIAGTNVSLLYIRLHQQTADALGATNDSVLCLDATLKHVRADVHAIAPHDLELIRPVGSGAFGDAMLAKWHHTTDVVVKTLHRDLFRSSDALAAFQHEAAVMHLLGKHPHVVELLGVCCSIAGSSNSSESETAGDSSTESFALVTEYLPHGSIEDVLQTTTSLSSSPQQQHFDFDSNADTFTKLYDSSRSPSRTSTSTHHSLDLFARTLMARDAAHGLTTIHDGHVLHCDIAARNCLVDAHFRVKVCDFGLARHVHSSRKVVFDDTRHGFGPLKWMAPESVVPPHIFSTHTDSYMFGVLLFEIFTGERPFPTLSTRDVIALIQEGKHVAIPRDLPNSHQQLMRKCFERHPLHRPTMDDIYATLDQWIVQDTTTHVVGGERW